MTIADLLLRPDEAWLAADTLILLGDQPLAFSTKILLWPHIAAAAVCRGPVKVQSTLAYQIGHAFLPHGVEDAVAVFADTLATVSAACRLEWPELFPPGQEAEGFICGWSPTRERFVAWYCDAADGEPRPLAPGLFIMPRGPAEGSPFEPIRPPDVTPGHLVKVAQLQGAAMNRGGRREAGGDLMVAHLSLDGLSIRKTARLPHHAELLAAMQEPAGRG